MDTSEVLHLWHLDEPQGELLVGRGQGGDVERLHCLDALHQFRNCASSGNLVIYDNSIPGLHGRSASVAYPYLFSGIRADVVQL